MNHANCCSNDVFTATHEIVKTDPDILAAAKSGARMKERVELNRLVAGASYILALMYFEKVSLIRNRCIGRGLNISGNRAMRMNPLFMLSAISSSSKEHGLA